MNDMTQLLCQLGGQGIDAQTLEQLQTLMNSAQCQALVGQLRTSAAGQLEQAVMQGDADNVRQAVGQFLSTPEGTALAAQLRQALGK